MTSRMNSAIREVLFDHMLKGVGNPELDQVMAALRGFDGIKTIAPDVSERLMDLESAQGQYTETVAEAAFFLGMQCGADPRVLLCAE